MLKVLSIGTDRKLFEDDSAVLLRNIDYASKMEELHIIVFSQKNLGLKTKIVGNLYIHPTNSLSRIHYVFDAVRIGKGLIENWKLKIENSRNLVISTQDPFETGLVGYLLSRKFNIPLQLQFHTDFSSPNFKNSVLNRLRVLIANFLIPKAYGLRVVRDSIKTSLEKNFQNMKVAPQVLPVFVDIEKILNTSPVINLENDFKRFKFIVLMASRLTKEKRIDVGLRALKSVLNKYPKTGFIIAGEGQEEERLKDLAKKLEVDKNVLFVGWQKDLIPFYKVADVFLLTSEYEGYAMSLIEAGASGCPIITTRVGVANTDLFVNNQNSFICDVGDENCIAISIMEIIEDNSKRELFKHSMQASIKKVLVSRSEYVSKYVDLLEDVSKEYNKVNSKG